MQKLIPCLYKNVTMIARAGLFLLRCYQPVLIFRIFVCTNQISVTMDKKKLPKAYAQQPSDNIEKPCAKEPIVEYQPMKHQLVSPCRFTVGELNAEVDDSMAQIAEGETVGYETAMDELRKMVNLN